MNGVDSPVYDSPFLGTVDTYIPLSYDILERMFQSYPWNSWACMLGVDFRYRAGLKTGWQIRSLNKGRIPRLQRADTGDFHSPVVFHQKEWAIEKMTLVEGYTMPDTSAPNYRYWRFGQLDTFKWSQEALVGVITTTAPVDEWWVNLGTWGIEAFNF